MIFLQDTHPWLFDSFENGLHAVRRTNRHWSGLWSVLVIEQTQMISMKLLGGLTRGRGMTQCALSLGVKLTLQCQHSGCFDFIWAKHKEQ